MSLSDCRLGAYEARNGGGAFCFTHKVIKRWGAKCPGSKEELVSMKTVPMKTFTMYRRNDTSGTHDANQANAPDEPQFQGVVFSDGKVAIRWLTLKGSTSVWDSLDDMLAIHGHPEYGSELIWD